MTTIRDIRTFARTVADKFDPTRIILFGSHARGEAGTDSDVDLLVVMAHRGHPTEQAIEIRTQVECRFALDLLVRSPAEIRRRLRLDDWFIREIMEQGKVLYEADDHPRRRVHPSQDHRSRVNYAGHASARAGDSTRGASCRHRGRV